jgi:hypothetical protein
MPAEAWDAAGNTHPPESLGQHFHLNEQLLGHIRGLESQGFLPVELTQSSASKEGSLT